MPLLAYCLAEAEPEIEFPAAGVPAAGVLDLPVEAICEGGLRCFVSRSSEMGAVPPLPGLGLKNDIPHRFRGGLRSSVPGGTPEVSDVTGRPDEAQEVERSGGHQKGEGSAPGEGASGKETFAARAAFEKGVRENPVAFNRTLQAIFKHVAILPFRFPTLLADEAELRLFVRQNSGAYAETLRRLRGVVQMEVHISSRGPAAGTAGKAAESGASYLRNRQARRQEFAAAAGQMRHAGEPWITRWREREAASGVRCYALVPRGSVDAFVRQMSLAQLSPSFSARVTGPWPATEFVRET